MMARESYGISPDYPFENDFETAVYRHPHNKKWFALSMTIPKSKLGLAGEELIDVVNIKCAQEILPDLWQEAGLFPAYHMNKRHWLTVALDGSAEDATVLWLIGMSFDLTRGR